MDAEVIETLLEKIIVNDNRDKLKKNVVVIFFIMDFKK